MGSYPQHVRSSEDFIHTSEILWFRPNYILVRSDNVFLFTTV